ncbi:S1C family serine protease [Simiduia aestuariiviva]|uniref:S1-C subfamily serine protease n=1 Tax=Simiduia aestuariiviva TaxID=1510459 RepID=A0A839UVY6_9GAMM|nr:trypsin-like peptidase domain-containing protein [Simiduia aestuariiviva]MBB3169495.1 S1-C subfamily serine protease [Simiduia aestuariiviva]
MKIYALLIALYALGFASHSTAQDWQAVANRVAPAMVSVTAVGERQQPEMPEELKTFFGERLGAKRSARTNGSGFFISADGLILTAFSTIENAKEVLVVTHDQRRFRAEVVGANALLDIGLLKVPASGQVAVALAPTEPMAVGLPVATMGFPFDLGLSFTAGVVSSIDQYANADGKPYIQATLYTNRGQAGGPLLNASGEAVGVISAIMTDGPQFSGISLSTPIAFIQDALPALKQGASWARPVIGLAGSDVWLQSGSEKFERLNVVITEVVARGPAARAGILAGDRVTAFADQPIKHWLQLAALVARSTPGQAYTVQVVRDGKLMKFNLVPELPSKTETAN